MQSKICTMILYISRCLYTYMHWLDVTNKHSHTALYISYYFLGCVDKHSHVEFVPPTRIYFLLAVVIYFRSNILRQRLNQVNITSKSDHKATGRKHLKSNQYFNWNPLRRKMYKGNRDASHFQPWNRKIEDRWERITTRHEKVGKIERVGRGNEGRYWRDGGDEMVLLTE